jgi:molybdate transport system ATP-binding protein
MLAFDIEKRLGDFTLAAKFDAAGRATALFGPSGAGKTTIVNLIAGLITPDRGRIVLDETVLFDDDRGINMPPHLRRIGYVFQEGRLFPHLTVAQNLSYGRWMNRLEPDPDGDRRMIALLDIGPLLGRRPGALSGGERQRVAIGRALLLRPRLLLLDEPLAALDPARKREILPYLARLQEDVGIPTIYVSHHAGEIKRIATEVVRIEAGRAIATGGLELLDSAAADWLA